ncbi:MAG: TIGR00282 family metallophosphoesterase [Deltaproteobacteria bacterium]|nr:TIGR00282 family metallophosphoesterase [Deltaproteobacteria bacterium]
MRLLFLGDVVGKGARQVLRRRLRGVRRERGVEFVVANGENAAGGKGLDPDSADELFDAGVDVITTGNHVWQHRTLLPVLEHETRILRPANFPEGNPGRGWTVQRAANGSSVAVVNLIGRVFMGGFDCPFRAVDRILAQIAGEADVVLVDMHAETTSEKVAMGWHLAGRVAGVVGSHTHVQTADERVLPGGTAYLTDAGMCGPVDSVIGMRRDEVLRRFLNQMPVRFEVAKGPIVVQGALLDVDPGSGRATAIERVQEAHETC